MSEASEDTQSACASPTGCLRPGECAHGCSWAVDELTRLGQEMEAPGRIAALEEENRVLRKTVGDLHDGINQIFREALKERNANRALARDLRRYQIAWRRARTRARSAGSAADRYAARASAGQEALQDNLVAIIGGQMERQVLEDRVRELEAALEKERKYHQQLHDGLNRLWNEANQLQTREGVEGLVQDREALREQVQKLEQKVEQRTVSNRELREKLRAANTYIKELGGNA